MFSISVCGKQLFLDKIFFSLTVFVSVIREPRPNLLPVFFLSKCLCICRLCCNHDKRYVIINMVQKKNGGRGKEEERFTLYLKKTTNQTLENSSLVMNQKRF